MSQTEVQLIKADAVQTGDIANSAVTDAKISALTASKLTGALPAISGASLTNLPASGITHARTYRLTTSYTLNAANATLTANWEYDDSTGVGSLGSGWSLPSSGVFSFPATGIYEVRAHTMWYGVAGTNTPYGGIHIEATTNNSSYASRSGAYSSQEYDNLNATRYHNVHIGALFDVTNVSNDKFRITTFRDVNYGDIVFMGNTADNYTYLEVIRLGDT